MARPAGRPLGGRLAPGRLRHQDRHPGPARGQPAAADRRDRGGHAQLDRPRQPGPRAFPGRDAAGAARSRHPALGLRRRLRRARVRRDLRRAPAERGRRDRAEPLVPERGRGAGIRCRDRRRLPGGDRAAALRQAVAGLRRDLAEVGAGGRRRRAPTGSPLVNTMRGLALDGRLAAGAWRAAVRRLPGSGAAARSRSRPCYACRAATELPIVGMGGVRSGPPAVLELVACGATHAALGTVLFGDPEAPQRVRGELDQALAEAEASKRPSRRSARPIKLVVNSRQPAER